MDDRQRRAMFAKGKSSGGRRTSGVAAAKRSGHHLEDHHRKSIRHAASMVNYEAPDDASPRALKMRLRYRLKDAFVTEPWLVDDAVALAYRNLTEQHIPEELFLAEERAEIARLKAEMDCGGEGDGQ